ncbi:MAG: HU family DNA-binding protein [Bacteroidetes bacterium]|nr:HU family DNA-binding protein [Bacteroidota bacterium]
MTKAKLIQAIAQKTGLTKLETQAVLTGFWDTVIESLAQGESVELRGFGSFRVQHRPPRKARNPATGESIQVDARRVPVFKPAREFKDQVNQPLGE